MSQQVRDRCRSSDGWVSLLSRPKSGLVAILFLVTALTSCRGPDPGSLRFGYRWDDDGNVVIAYPICPAYKVSGADITIRLQSGEKSTFKTLWSAKGATSSEVARGIFTVGAPDSFRQGGTPSRRRYLRGSMLVSTKFHAMAISLPRVTG